MVLQTVAPEVRFLLREPEEIDADASRFKSNSLKRTCMVCGGGLCYPICNSHFNSSKFPLE